MGLCGQAHYGPAPPCHTCAVLEDYCLEKGWDPYGPALTLALNGVPVMDLVSFYPTYHGVWIVGHCRRAGAEAWFAFRAKSPWSDYYAPSVVYFGPSEAKMHDIIATR